MFSKLVCYSILALHQDRWICFGTKSKKPSKGKTPFLLLVQILEVLNKERNGRALLANFAEEWSRLETAFKHVRGVFEFRVFDTIVLFLNSGMSLPKERKAKNNWL
ncbi:hypothetical protein AXX17_AT4G43190 [Arabidopsis thaliana]|uniref:Uncharacterized protein n=1 Tax=Arabidopsis thaliana TaxID=3702 RepID=A0A178UUV9_ARATH|nr:hypothetical protein AXX17_AT4G43190 [Arabidopsis thaliana]